MTAQIVTETLVTGGKRRGPDRRSGQAQHKGAIVVFVAPFGVLFALFYLVPIGYAIWQSLLVVEREGTFGPAQEVFGGLAQYALVFQNGPFWASVGAGAALRRRAGAGDAGPRAAVRAAARLAAAARQEVLPARVLRAVRRARRHRRDHVGLPLLAQPLAVHAPSPSSVDFLSADLVLWAMANVVTWVYVGYNMLIIYSSLLAIPTEIYEAARLDGAGQVRIAWSIKIPLVLPGARADRRLLDHRHAAAARRAAGVPQLQLRGHEHVHPEPDGLLDLRRCPNFNLAAAFSVVLALATFVLSFTFLRITRRKADA